MHLIFDLDGTLVDSRPGIQHALHQAAQKVFLDHDPAKLNFEIGPPVREMFRRALENVNETTLDELEETFRISYDNEAWRATYAYPGVGETLAELTRRKSHSYVVTNKPALSTVKILSHLNLSCHLDDVICPDSRQPNFRCKAEMIFHLLEKYCVPVENAWYVGDTADDWRAAESCGLSFVGVEYGYGTIPRTGKPPRRVQSFTEILFTE